MLKLDVNDNSKMYQVGKVWDSAVYTKNLKLRHLLDLYYLVVWKTYLEKENT